MNTQHALSSPTESESRLRILHAAHALFVTHGFKAVSMQQVADAAHIHKATLYHHFASKEAMFSEVVIMAFEAMHHDVAHIIEVGGTATEQMVQVAHQLFAQTQSEFGRLMTDVHEQMTAEARIALFRERSYPWELMRQIVVSASQAGELPEVDPDLVVSMFIGLVWGQIFMRKLERISSPLDEGLAATLVEILFAGLRNAPGAARGDVAG